MENQDNKIRSPIHEETVKMMYYRRFVGDLDIKDKDGNVLESFVDTKFEKHAMFCAHSSQFFITKKVEVPKNFSRVFLTNYKDLIKIALLKGKLFYQFREPKSQDEVLCIFYLIDKENEILYESEHIATGRNG